MDEGIGSSRDREVVYPAGASLGSVECGSSKMTCRGNKKGEGGRRRDREGDQEEHVVSRNLLMSGLSWIEVIILGLRF